MLFRSTHRSSQPRGFVLEDRRHVESFSVGDGLPVCRYRNGARSPIEEPIGASHPVFVVAPLFLASRWMLSRPDSQRAAGCPANRLRDPVACIADYSSTAEMNVVGEPATANRYLRQRMLREPNVQYVRIRLSN